MSIASNAPIAIPDPIVFRPAPYDPTQYRITDPTRVHEAARRAAIAAYIAQFVPYRWFSGIDNAGTVFDPGARYTGPSPSSGSPLRAGGAIVDCAVNVNNTTYSWVDRSMLAAMDRRVAGALRQRQAILSPGDSCSSAGLLDLIAPTIPPAAIEYAVQYTPQPMDWPDVHLIIARDIRRARGHCKGWERRGDHIFLFFAARNRAKDCAYDHGHSPIIPIREGFTRDDHLIWYGPVGGLAQVDEGEGEIDG